MLIGAFICTPQGRSQLSDNGLFQAILSVSIDDGLLALDDRPQRSAPISCQDPAPSSSKVSGFVAYECHPISTMTIMSDRKNWMMAQTYASSVVRLLQLLFVRPCVDAVGDSGRRWAIEIFLSNGTRWGLEVTQHVCPTGTPAADNRWPPQVSSLFVVSRTTFTLQPLCKQCEDDACLTRTLSYFPTIAHDGQAQSEEFFGGLYSSRVFNALGRISVSRKDWLQSAPADTDSLFSP